MTMRGWSVVCVMSAVLSSACAHTGPAPAAPAPAPAPTAAEACAALEEAPPPASCEGLPADHGLSPTHPLEWALLATRPGLTKTLVCADGTKPELGNAKGSLIAPHPRSSSPRGGFATRFETDDAEFLDTWTVACGDTRYSLVTNAYRCGSPCPPRGLARVPREVVKLLDEGWELLEKNQAGRARVSFAKAVERAPELERPLSALATATARDGAVGEARALYAKLRQKNPREVWYELAEAMMRAQDGDPPALRAKLDELQARLPASHELRGVVLCHKAHLLHRDEATRAEAFPLADEACAAGEKACCELAKKR
ncbi:MAG: tetratricopeptide repeat protein [Myxococcota bacterium]